MLLWYIIRKAYSYVNALASCCTYCGVLNQSIIIILISVRSCHEILLTTISSTCTHTCSGTGCSRRSNHTLEWGLMYMWTLTPSFHRTKQLPYLRVHPWHKRRSLLWWLSTEWRDKWSLQCSNPSQKSIFSCLASFARLIFTVSLQMWIPMKLLCSRSFILQVL